MHEERDTLWHFVMSIMKNRESHHVTVLDMYEIFDEEYIEELKDESENENTKNSTEWWKNKVGEWEKLASKFRRVQERCPRPTIIAVLSIQKFSDVAVYVINK